MPFVPALALFLAAGPADTAPIYVTGRRWAPFISPMGEPFRAATTADDTLRLWFDKADADHDGQLSQAEMLADADRFFARLDDNKDGRIDPDEVVRYEWQIAPDVQVGSPRRRQFGAPPPPPPREADRHKLDLSDPMLMGAARYALLNIPEPVTAADGDFNRVVTRDEFRAAALYRFGLLDRSHRGWLDFAALSTLRDKMLADAARKAKKLKRNEDEDDERVATPL